MSLVQYDGGARCRTAAPPIYGVTPPPTPATSGAQGPQGAQGAQGVPGTAAVASSYLIEFDGTAGMTFGASTPATFTFALIPFDHTNSAVRITAPPAPSTTTNTLLYTTHVPIASYVAAFRFAVQALHAPDQTPGPTVDVTATLMRISPADGTSTATPIVAGPVSTATTAFPSNVVEFSPIITPAPGSVVILPGELITVYVQIAGGLDSGGGVDVTVVAQLALTPITP